MAKARETDEIIEQQIRFVVQGVRKKPQGILELIGEMKEQKHSGFVNYEHAVKAIDLAVKRGFIESRAPEHSSNPFYCWKYHPMF